MSSIWRRTTSHPRSLPSIATLNRARSRTFIANCNLFRIAQTCFGFRGGFCPVDLPLFQGTRPIALSIFSFDVCMVFLLTPKTRTACAATVRMSGGLGEYVNSRRYARPRSAQDFRCLGVSRLIRGLWRKGIRVKGCRTPAAARGRRLYEALFFFLTASCSSGLLTALSVVLSTWL